MLYAIGTSRVRRILFQKAYDLFLTLRQRSPHLQKPLNKINNSSEVMNRVLNEIDDCSTASIKMTNVCLLLVSLTIFL